MNLRPTFAFTLLLAACSLRAAPLPANSRIAAVTVYVDRAVVTRNTTLDLAAPGTVEVTFEKLPAALLDQSLQVAGRGTAQTTILDVTARATFVDFTPNERVKALEDELRGLARQRRTLDDRTAVLKSQEASLNRLETAATSAPVKDGAPRLSIEESAKLLAFLEDQRGKLATDRQALDTQLEDLAAKQTAAERQLNELRGAGGRSYKTVTVRLDATTAGSVNLALTYAVPGASWTPVYDAHALSAEHSVQLGYFDLVRQNTGEDWKNIDLTLSTARPSLGGAAPELNPWAVDVRQMVPMPAPMLAQASDAVTMAPFEKRAENKGYYAANTLSGTRMNSEIQDMASSVSVVETQATSATFHTPVATDVPSDNAPHKVGVATVALKTDPSYQTTPKRLPVAFLTAKVVNSSDFPLLSGAMSVFLDGTFVATSALRTVMPGEKFDLSLGADEGITVKHKRVNRFTEDTGLTNSGKRITYEYLLTIQNNKPIAARVVVSDQIPVSRNEKVVVKQLAPDAKEFKPTPEGMLKWTLDLKPGEKRELMLKFSLDYPNDVQVTGAD